MLQFMLRYSPYGVVPGMWFAYIAGMSPWYGAAAGLTMTFLVGLPARLLGGNGSHDEAEGSQ
jgi:hypothetical protein